jgi:hypothetical protein
MSATPIWLVIGLGIAGLLLIFGVIAAVVWFARRRGG